MTSRQVLRVPAGVVCALAIACTDRPRVTAPAAAPPAASGMSLSVDDMVAGRSTAIRGVFRRQGGMRSVGSFTFRISYDTTKLSFDRDASTGAGMRLMNARDGVLSIAGASTEGFASDTLFVARFRVQGLGAGPSISLDIGEMHSVAFDNLIPALDARGGIRDARFRGLAR